MSTSSQRTSPIDHAHLARYTLGNTALEHEVLGLFREQATPLLAELAGAQTPSDWKHYAHTLKGSARAVGAWQVGYAAEAAERLSWNVDPGTRLAAIAALRIEIDSVSRYIGTLLAA